MVQRDSGPPLGKYVCKIFCVTPSPAIVSTKYTLFQTFKTNKWFEGTTIHSQPSPPPTKASFIPPKPTPPLHHHSILSTPPTTPHPSHLSHPSHYSHLSYPSNYSPPLTLHPFSTQPQTCRKCKTLYLEGGGWHMFKCRFMLLSTYGAKKSKSPLGSTPTT